MYKESLNIYDVKPETMINYLRYNGRHFSKKLCEWAVKQIKSPYRITKSQIDELLKNNNIVLENNQLYDYVYVANYCKAHLYGNSIEDDDHLIKYVKDIIESTYDGGIFNRWYSDMCGQGIIIDWEENL